MKRNHPIAYAVAAALLATAFVGCTVQQGGEPVSATDAVTTTAEVTTTAATTAATEVTVTAATTAVAEVTTTAAVTTAAVATESPKTEKSTEGMTQLAFLSENHSPKAAGDKVMENMICISSDAMKGAHDAQYVFANGKAYVVYEANDKQAGDLGTDAAEYSALAIVDLDTFTVESIEKFVCSGQVFANETLPAGSCFVPRVIRKDDATLRFFFASQADGRQARTYYVDYDLATETFDKNVYRLKLQTASGKVDLTPLAYITAFRAEGRACGTSTRGVYLFDIFDIGDTKYVALNNFNNGQNSLAKFNDTYDCIEIIGNIGSMTDTVKTTENGIIQLKDGTWMAILRNERGDKNYLFSYSKDGTDWSYPAAEDFVQKGTNSKPILARFGDYYLMGYNETSRKTFHLAYSTDAKNWTKLYTFVSPTTFQYPEFDLYDGQIYFSVTMGSKERICFGKLGIVEKDGKLYIEEVTGGDVVETVDTAAFEDLSTFTLISNTVQTKQDGSVVCATYVKRDDKGVYLYGETEGTLASGKLFFMLDTQGTAEKLSAAASPDNLMFRFYNGAIQVKAVDASGGRSYKDLTTFDGVECFQVAAEEGTKVGIYLPYAAIQQIAPKATFTDTAADLYICVYGAEGSFESVPTHCGQTVDWEKPSTYVILTADGMVKAR